MPESGSWRSDRRPGPRLAILLARQKSVTQSSILSSPIRASATGQNPLPLGHDAPRSPSCFGPEQPNAIRAPDSGTGPAWKLCRFGPLVRGGGVGKGQQGGLIRGTQPLVALLSAVL